MIILTSNGISNSVLVDETKKYINDTFKKAVIITTASPEYKELDHNIPAITESLLSLGLKVDYFDIEIEDVNKLKDYDLMLINGGNPFYLLNQIRITNCAETIKDFGENKILIGISAGSIVLGENLDLVYEFNPEMNDQAKLTNFICLNLTEINIAPHYTRYLDKYEKMEQVIASAENNNNISYARLNDGEAIFINATTYKL